MAIVEGLDQRLPGAPACFDHFAGLGHVQREGFLAQDGFAGLECTHGPFEMHAGRQRVVDEVDVVAGDELGVVRGDAGNVVLLGKSLGAGRVAGTDGGDRELLVVARRNDDGRRRDLGCAEDADANGSFHLTVRDRGS